jgi:F0F1-type ATP synthase assembly protein I
MSLTWRFYDRLLNDKKLWKESAPMKLWQIVVTCLLVGLAAGYTAKMKERSPWLWGILGFVFLGIIVHTVVGILVFLIFA